MSRANRRRGHNYERAIAKWLREHGWPDAHTTRSALGHDGFSAPGDVVGPPGVVIEAKDVAGSAWPTWLRQTRLEADGCDWICVRRRRGQTDVAMHPARWSHGGVEFKGTFAEAIRNLTIEEAHDG